jgi:hypothetical protein
MRQRPDETKEEFAARRIRKAEKRSRRLAELHDIAAKPRDLYADTFLFHEENGVMRLEFGCTRPATDDGFGAMHVPVARLSFRFKVFQYEFDRWLKSQAGRDATSE